MTDPHPRSTPSSSPSAEPDGGDDAFLDELFAGRDRYLERDPYRSIGEAAEFFTKVVGVSFEGRQDIVGGLRAGDALTLERRPDNPHDPNAIAVCYGALQLGYLRREIARHVAPRMDGGARYRAVVASVTGGDRRLGDREGAAGDAVDLRSEKRNRGVNVRVTCVSPSFAASPFAAPSASARQAPRGAGLERSAPTSDPGPDVDVLRSSLIGAHALRPAQEAVLERVFAGRRTLAILGTGRGKSLCFQLPAALRALERGEKTLVLYPLRALANDQFEAMRRKLAPFGVRILRANGAIDDDERALLNAALEDGAWDVILATPEFTQFHVERFARPDNRPHLLVVDECHHLFESKHRPAYGALATLLRALGEPQVLALTATANDEAFAHVRAQLGIEAWVIDPTVRENLRVVDGRGTRDKLAYLRRALGDDDGRAIVYCNSRTEATTLAERLRRIFRDVAFYHAGVGAAERVEVERRFRAGTLRIVVATSAFGEGVDLPDVRDVVLYHLNFSFTEFNQQAGRAGRDGALARIHLLYGEPDRRINDYIIRKSAPTVELLRELFRGMRGLARERVLRMRNADVARTLDLEMADDGTVAAALRIFADLGLVEIGTDDDGRFVRFLDPPGRVDLSASARYAEGEMEREGFERFCDLALTADPETLCRIVNRPIYPERAPLIR